MRFPVDVTHILLVESDPAVAGQLKASLERSEGVCVETVPSLGDGLKGVGPCAPDFIVLDLNASVIDGFEVTQVLRSRRSASARPVLVLQRCRPGDQRFGGDTSIHEISLRKRLHQFLNAAQRRRLDPWELSAYRDDHLTADFGAGRFVVDGRSVDLTPREQDLLHLLIEQTDRVVSRRELHEQLWGYETRSLDVYVRRLRIRLGSSNTQIETVPGFGYRFVPHGPASRVPQSIAHSSSGGGAATPNTRSTPPNASQ